MRNFDKIYERKLWGEEGNGSGTGSMLHTTVSVRNFITDLIRNQGVRKIVDVSVGGMTWWPEVLNQFPEVEFFGYDISLIKTKENKEKFREKSNWKFYFADLVSKKDYPDCDLIICRHTLNHLCKEDVLKSIDNLKQVNYRFLGITQHAVNEIDIQKNIQSDTPGCIDYRPINLSEEPIGMPSPIMEVDDADAEDVQMNCQRKFSIWGK
jgi:hypothetical protein